MIGYMYDELPETFEYNDHDYGTINCSPELWSAAQKAHEFGEQLTPFLLEAEKFIQLRRPKWSLERLLDYAGPRAVVLLLGASEELASQFPEVSNKWMEKILNWSLCKAEEKPQELVDPSRTVCPKCSAQVKRSPWWDDPPHLGGACIGYRLECTFCGWSDTY